MRKVLFAINISIDGCYQHTNFNPDEQLMKYYTRLMKDTDLIVYGRKTYELMIPYWPEVARNPIERPCDLAFADAMTPIEKIVISRTLNHAEENCRIINENPEDLIRQLKQTTGKKIMFSSISMLPRLLELHLIDELYLVIHPVILGEDKRLFENFYLSEKINFKLKYTQLFESGVIALQYEKNNNKEEMA